MDEHGAGADVPRLEDAAADAYLARIGAATDASLAELQERHLRTVPFENLDIHLGVPIVLDPAAMVGKLVDRRRGGFCYELNGSFAGLLRTLGHRCTLLAAKVCGEDGRLGPPFDHLALLVHDREDGAPFLVDVGFGRFAPIPCTGKTATTRSTPPARSVSSTSRAPPATSTS